MLGKLRISAASAIIMTAPALAQARSFDVPAQPASTGIQTFAKQADIQLLAARKDTRDKQTNAVRGLMPVDAALQQLLAGTGLSAYPRGQGTYTVMKTTLLASAAPAAALPAAPAPVQEVAPRAEKAHVAAAEPGDGVSADIVVTATKRETTLQTTAAAVSVVGSDLIAARHLGGADDYLAGLPGVSYQDRGAGANTITIRGIGNGSQADPNSPVGTYFGETPVNGLGSEANGNQAGNADIKLVDIQRVEVLRGPQGTLYGSGTMGGTVRVIPNAPKLDRVEGSASAEYSNTARFGGNNYKLQAVANTPLVRDTLGLRVVAYRFFDDGFIKNVAGSRPTANILTALALNKGISAIDTDHMGASATTGFRGTVLWKPMTDLSVTLMYLRQDDKNTGLLTTDLALGDYYQARVQVGDTNNRTEFIKTQLNLANAALQYDFGWGSLLNSTSVLHTAGDSELEFTFYSPIFLGESTPRRNNKDLFINETRFASKFRGPFQILAGLYYENRRLSSNNVIRFTGTPPAPPGLFEQQLSLETSQKQYAAFGEASLKLFDDKLTLTGGGRYFKFDLAIPLSTSSGVPDTNQGRSSSVSGTTWKGNISYEFSKQLFAYALFSQGFRAPLFQKVVLRADDPDGDGVIGFADGAQRKVPQGLLAPDRVTNYEAGIKFRTPDRAFQASISGFWIDWTGIPLVPSLSAVTGTAFYFNAGKARSKGVEFESTVRLPARLLFTGALSYIDSVLAESQPGLGAKGARLPGSAKWNASASLEKRFDLGGHDAFVRGDYTYVGGYYSTLAMTGPVAGNYHLFDLSAGVTLNKINLGVFAKNITNNKSATWYDNTFTTRAYRLRPRTMGVRAGIEF